ncbi:MAG: PadR family transcriptional regulator [Bacteroidota bacterium]
MYSKELLKGTLKTIILSLLEENGRMYGYEITKKVKEQSAGEIQLTEGALYPTLHALEAAKLVTVEKESIGNRVRKYYRITEMGTTKSKERVDEFYEFVSTMKRILTPQTI